MVGPPEKARRVRPRGQRVSRSRFLFGNVVIKLPMTVFLVICRRSSRPSRETASEQLSHSIGRPPLTCGRISRAVSRYSFCTQCT
jgi:hypothetical protein